MSSLLSGFIMFALVAGFTPGPNNLMVAASGVNFGYRRSVPHLLGVIVGFPVLMLGVGFGLGEIFQRFPIVHEALKIAGSIYLLFLAWKIATAGNIDNENGEGKPLTFLQAALFQWVNPKAWIMVLATITTYTHQAASYHLQIVLLAGIAMLVTTASINTWCLFGVSLRTVLATRPRLLLAFNYSMGLLLAGSLIPVWF